MAFPTQLQINAWTGDGVTGNVASIEIRARSKLLSREPKPIALKKLAPPDISPINWQDENIGWGIILPDRAELSASQKANAEDAPEAVRALLETRGHAPVLRYNPAGPLGSLTRYYGDGQWQQVAISALNYGIGRGRIPRYLLILGSPSQIPWSVQYELQTGYFVGRLDLEGEALENYIAALANNWAASGPIVANTTIWAVDHGSHDITHLMRNAVALPIHNEFLKDEDPAFKDGTQLLIDDQATAQTLISALANRRPSLVVTSSHGATGPLSDIDQMRLQLGLMVDRNHTMLDVAGLLADWTPSGAIWFGQACCSAGSAAQTSYAGLVPTDSAVGRILEGVARCGSMTAPLPRALLGAKEPLRAFVGHVEPTFDWTLRHPDTKQFLTRPLINAFYNELFRGKPVGLALGQCRVAASSLNESYRLAADALANGEDRDGEVFALELMSKDWRSLVLLGDPTCRLIG